MSQVVRRVIVYVLYFLIVVVIVGAIVIALTSNDKTEAPSENGMHTQHTDESNSGSTQSGSTSGMQVATQAGGQTSNNSSATTPAQSSSAELTNTGPGDTVAVFVASTIIGILLYRRVLLKQSS